MKSEYIQLPSQCALVERYFILEGKSDPQQSNFILPDGTVGLLFIDSGTIYRSRLNYKDADLLKDGVLIGQKGEAIEYGMDSTAVRMYGAKINPILFQQLYKIPAGVFTEQIVDLNELNDDRWELYHELANGLSSIMDKLILLNTFLNKMVAPPTKAAVEFYTLLKLSLSSQYFFSLKNFIVEHNVSYKKFERDCYKYLGLSPKHFLRIFRLNRSIVALGTCAVQEQVAFTHGYYDYSHFVRDCKSLTGCTPKQLYNKVDATQKIYLESHPELSPGVCDSNTLAIHNGRLN